MRNRVQLAPLLLHGKKSFRAVVGVPLIIRAPWLGAGAPRVSALVELVDLLPTLTQLAGVSLPPDEQFDGVSLVPLLSAGGAAWQAKVAFSQYPRRVSHPDAPWDGNSILHKERSDFTHMGSARFRSRPPLPPRGAR